MCEVGGSSPTAVGIETVPKLLGSNPVRHTSYCSLTKYCLLAIFSLRLQWIKLPWLVFAGCEVRILSRHPLSRLRSFVVFPSPSNQMPNNIVNKVSFKILSNSTFVTIQPFNAYLVTASASTLHIKTRSSGKN
jgi:hypothetical protein